MTIRDVFFEPHLTFPRMPVDGRLMTPTTFVLMLQLTVGLISFAIWIALQMVQLPYYTLALRALRRIQGSQLPLWSLAIVIPVLWLSDSVGIGIRFPNRRDPSLGSDAIGRREQGIQRHLSGHLLLLLCPVFN